MCSFIQALRQIYRHFLTEMKSETQIRDLLKVKSQRNIKL